MQKEKSFYKVQYAFLLKTLESIGINGTFHKIISSIYLKPSASIICNRGKPDAFPVRSGVKQRCPLSPLLFNMVLEMPAVGIRQNKETKGIRIGKAETKLSLFADDVKIYLENPRDSSKSLLEIINNFGKVAGHKINPHKPSAFLYITKSNNER